MIGLKIKVNGLSQLSIPHDTDLPEFVIFFFRKPGNLFPSLMREFVGVRQNISFNKPKKKKSSQILWRIQLYLVIHERDISIFSTMSTCSRMIPGQNE